MAISIKPTNKGKTSAKVKTKTEKVLPESGVSKNKKEPKELFKLTALIEKNEENRMMEEININLAMNSLPYDIEIGETYVESLEKNLIFLSKNSDAFHNKVLSKASSRSVKNSEVRVL